MSAIRKAINNVTRSRRRPAPPGGVSRAQGRDSLSSLPDDTIQIRLSPIRSIILNSIKIAGMARSRIA